MKDKLIVGGIFYDLKKAFNCVIKDIHLSKLELHGITGMGKEICLTLKVGIRDF
jgi:hypothetical protein